MSEVILLVVLNGSYRRMNPHCSNSSSTVEKAPLSLHPDALTSSWRVIPIPLVARAVTTAIWSADYANRGSFAQPIGKPRADLSISGNSAKSLFILSSISLLKI